MGLYIDQFDKNDPIGNCGKKNIITKQLCPKIVDYELDLIVEKPRQTGCPAGMRCRYMHDFIGMYCVDENYDSLEDDTNEYDTWDSTAEVSWESHSQEDKITVKKSCIYYFC